MNIDWTGVWVTAAMYGLFLLIGWYASRKVKTGSASELLVAGRSLPLLMATLTMTATWVDGGYILGTAESTFTSIALALQGGMGFGLSLIVGGVFFASVMHKRGYTTFIDPFEERFGKKWAAVLSIPAILGELFWSAELMVAIGATFGVILNVDLTTAIIISAAIVTFYTMIGGLWAVAYTDAFQLLLIPIGLILAIPFILHFTGGDLFTTWSNYKAIKGDAASFLPPTQVNSFWNIQGITSWWDTSIMLILGGIPWNCYFQRVFSSKTSSIARNQSIIAGVLTIIMTIPPLILGMEAVVYWKGNLSEPALSVPLLLENLVPRWVALFGLAAIVGAVTSSFSSSILSAGSMFSWNWYLRLIAPKSQINKASSIIRISIVVLGIAAVYIALKVQSVQALWYFTSDLVFVLLFPQLLMALFDKKSNRTGSMVAFFVSLFLRAAGGEPLFGISPLFDYPEWWPVRTVAAMAGLILLPLVSRVVKQKIRSPFH
jgi:high affinity choline transporter 7